VVRSNKTGHNDALASPALTAATRLMQYLTEKSLQQNK